MFYYSKSLVNYLCIGKNIKIGYGIRICNIVYKIDCIGVINSKYLFEVRYRCIVLLRDELEFLLGNKGNCF